MEIRIPFAYNRGRAVLECVGLFAAFAVLLVYTSFGRDGERIVLIIQGVLSIILWIPTLMRCIAQISLRPEGISIMIFTWEYRWMSVERIKFLTGIRYSKRFDAMIRLAVCDRSYEELMEYELKHMGNHAQENTTMSGEEIVHKYLSRRAAFNIFRDYNLSKDVLWLEWSPDRVELLLRMYPNSDWKDCSPKREFDEQIKT